MKKYLSLITVLAFFSITAFAREGIYLEFKITVASMTGNNKVYSSDGDTRSEITMVSDAMPNPYSAITLVLHNAPDKVYNLNEKDKTYSETDAGKSSENNDDDYEITVLGKENINNYNCTHVSVRYKKSKHTSDMWLSKDIVGYAGYTVVKNKYLGGSKFFNALKDKGADGFVVRLVTNSEKGGKMQMDLVKAEKRTIAESLFSLGGYTKGASYTPGNGAVDAQAIQKMTPEERQKYIEQMKEKYKQPQH